MARFLRSYPTQPYTDFPPVLTGLIPAPGLAYTTPRFLIKDLAGQTTSPTVLTNVNAGGVSISAGSLPTGLSINADTGVISGTPTAVESQTVTIQAVGDGGTTTFDLTINVVVSATPSPSTSYDASSTGGSSIQSSVHRGSIR